MVKRRASASSNSDADLEPSSEEDAGAYDEPTPPPKKTKSNAIKADGAALTKRKAVISPQEDHQDNEDAPGPSTRRDPVRLPVTAPGQSQRRGSGSQALTQVAPSQALVMTPVYGSQPAIRAVTGRATAAAARQDPGQEDERAEEDEEAGGHPLRRTEKSQGKASMLPSTGGSILGSQMISASGGRGCGASGSAGLRRSGEMGPPTQARIPGRGSQAVTGRGSQAAGGRRSEASTTAAASQAASQDARNRLNASRQEVLKMAKLVEDYGTSQEDALNKYALNLSEEEVQDLAGRAVRFMLFHQHEKPGEPVPRLKLNAAILGDDMKAHVKAKYIPSLAIAIAQAKMISLFGMEMKEVKRGSEKAGTGYYVLHSALPVSFRQQLINQPADGPRRAFALLVLALIKMSGDKLERSALWRCLKTLGVDGKQKAGTPGCAFEEPAEELKRLELIRYVISTRVDSDEPNALLEWGECAYAEVTMTEVQEFIDKIFEQHKAKEARLTRSSDENVDIED